MGGSCGERGTVKARALLLCALVTVTLPACASLVQQRPDDPDPPVAVRQAPIDRPHVTVSMPDVTDVLSPNYNGRLGTPISAIVLHHTASLSNALAIAKYFQRRDARVSSHYVVDRDGSIVRCVPDALRAWHAGPSSFDGVANVNDYSIGIEICNSGDGIEPYPEAQVAAVTRLVACLAKQYDIPVDRVTRHRDVALPHGTKIDPSDNFDFAGVVVGASGMLAGDQGTATSAVGTTRSQL